MFSIRLPSSRSPRSRVLVRITSIKRVRRACFVSQVLLALTIFAQDINHDHLQEIQTLLQDEVRYVRAESEIYSVSKRLEQRFHSAAAATVITREDVIRSGARTIPDALRLAPGIQVAQISGNRWAVTSRGFNGRFANKLLVLIDGRSVYTPLFSGVHWEQQNLILDDIERIEVIRGPGAALWGANAVNGVINIITRSARDTTDGLVDLTTDFDDTDTIQMRLGHEYNDRLSYRIFGSFSAFDTQPHTTPDTTRDDWQFGLAGFRLDWQATRADTVMLQAAVNEGRFATAQIVPNPDTIMPPFSRLVNEDDEFRSFYTLTRWNRELDPDSHVSVVAYYDYIDRHEFADLDETRHTASIDIQTDFRLNERNEFVAGLGVRVSTDKFKGSETFVVRKTKQTDSLVSLFAQDRMELVQDELFLTLGTKVEYNDYTGAEFQPNLRLLWLPSRQQVVWAAAARAVRTPSRVEDGVGIVLERFSFDRNGETNIVTRSFLGNSEFDSEELYAYEIGYRNRLHTKLMLEVATFYHDYSNLFNVDVTTESTLAGSVRTTNFTGHSSNAMTAETYGVEVSTEWQPHQCWRIVANYAFVEVHEHNGSLTISDDETETTETTTPENQLNLQSYLELPWNVRCDTVAYYVDSIDDVDSYLRLDLRLAWTPNSRTEFVLAFQNLLDGRHTESGPTITGTINSEIRRTWYAGMKLRF